ncbi:hypothetical protein G9A89_010277 [Geosiphon pyriformis]|nr:hypothetical protein G9A89_010277 [Geosiphon pyriformis]
MSQTIQTSIPSEGIFPRPPKDEELLGFQFFKVLSEDPRTKTLNVLGFLQADNEAPTHAILLLEKTHFNNEEISVLARERVEKWISHESNDIYHIYFGTTKNNEKWPDFKVTIIWPATDMHIRKYSAQSRYLVAETPKIYQDVVKSFIEAIPISRIQWVYNILAKDKEAEKILLESAGEDGFIVLPDMKWDGVTLESLYLLAIVNRRDIHSLRDLNQNHLSFLKNLRRKILDFIPARFPGIRPDQLRLFVHYQPSYYHFHVHITHIAQDSIPGGIAIEKAHLLDTIIDNIANIAGDYYQRATLTYALGENEPLFSLLNDVGARVSPQT